jgi:hypothetical protein
MRVVVRSLNGTHTSALQRTTHTLRTSTDAAVHCILGTHHCWCTETSA